MTFYEKKLETLRGSLYANRGQIDVVKGIKNYIDNHCNDKVDLDYLSKNLFVSKFHLLRLFKKYYGQTPTQYIIDRRIENSKEKLRKGLSVTETCYAVGFESLSSFSHLFKRRIGRYPSIYQKEQLSTNK